MRRSPSDVIDLTDRLGCKFGNSRSQQNIGAASLQSYDLRVDGRIGGLISLFGHDHFVRPVAQAFAQSDEVIVSEIIVLIEYSNLSVGQVLEDVARASRRKLGSQPIVQG